MHFVSYRNISKMHLQGGQHSLVVVCVLGQCGERSENTHRLTDYYFNSATYISLFTYSH